MAYWRTLIQQILPILSAYPLFFLSISHSLLYYSQHTKQIKNRREKQRDIDTFSWTQRSTKHNVGSNGLQTTHITWLLSPTLKSCSRTIPFRKFLLPSSSNRALSEHFDPPANMLLFKYKDTCLLPFLRFQVPWSVWMFIKGRNEWIFAYYSYSLQIWKNITKNLLREKLI